MNKHKETKFRRGNFLSGELEKIQCSMQLVQGHWLQGWCNFHSPFTLGEGGGRGQQQHQVIVVDLSKMEKDQLRSHSEPCKINQIGRKDLPCCQEMEQRLASMKKNLEELRDLTHLCSSSNARYSTTVGTYMNVLQQNQNQNYIRCARNIRQNCQNCILQRRGKGSFPFHDC